MDKQTSEQSHRRKDSNADQARSEIEAGRTPPLEWAVAAIGFLLVAGAIGFLVYQGVRGDEGPPAILLRVDSIAPTGVNYLVRIKAINQGGEAVKALVVEGKLTDGAAIIESNQITFDYVPARSERLGGFFFTHDPRRFEIQLRAHGYEQP